MRISAAYYSAIGGRKQNEDAATILESGGTVLGLVADGLGGYAGGDIASTLAINTITSDLGNQPVSSAALNQAIRHANDAIIESKRCKGMKSTIAAVWFDDTCGLAASVGDTRIYQIRNQSIIFQSRDHSVAQMEVMAGELNAEDIRGNSDRNRLIRALGAKDDVKADIKSLDIKPRDALLLCSDGFWEYIWEPEMIESLCSSVSASGWLEKMRYILNDRIKGNSDNHTAVAIIVQE